MMTEKNSDAIVITSSALNAPTDQSLRVPYYCEENVWRLAYRKLHQYNNDNKDKSHHLNADDELYVTFITNPSKCVPMFHQLASAGDNKPCCFWDYHVILHSSTTIYDIDCTLKYPCDIGEYINQVFPSEEFLLVNEEYRPWFRVINASTYLKHFSSDRMHMFDKRTKRWNAPPPTYPCILGVGSKGRGDGDDNANAKTTNLEYYMTISSKDIQQQQQQQQQQSKLSCSISSSEDMPYGKIYDLVQFTKKRFVSK